MRSFVYIGILLLGAAACSGASETESVVNETSETPFYQVHKNGTGPLTMEELQINIPEELDAKLSDRRRDCYLAKIEELAAEAGDPETLSTADVAFLPAQEEWNELTRYGKRSLLAQAVVSRAITLC